MSQGYASSNRKPEHSDVVVSYGFYGTETSTGTLCFDLDGADYQSAQLTDSSVITVLNPKAPSRHTMQSVHARIYSDGTAHALWLDDQIKSGGFILPDFLFPDETVLIHFQCYGARTEDVYGVVLVGSIPYTGP